MRSKATVSQGSQISFLQQMRAGVQRLKCLPERHLERACGGALKSAFPSQKKKKALNSLNKSSKMFSLPRTQARALLRSSLRRTAISRFSSHAYRPLHLSLRPTNTNTNPTPLPLLSSRSYSTQPEPESADELIELLTDQYGTARDEFEIASEETDKKSIYAEDDRAAALEEWNLLKEMYERALEGRFGEEVRTRVGHRIRELERGMEGLEERAKED
jgi:hypothetical protein